MLEQIQLQMLEQEDKGWDTMELDFDDIEEEEPSAEGANPGPQTRRCSAA